MVESGVVVRVAVKGLSEKQCWNDVLLHILLLDVLLLHFPLLRSSDRSLLKPLTKFINLVKYGLKLSIEIFRQLLVIGDGGIEE